MPLKWRAWLRVGAIMAVFGALAVFWVAHRVHAYGEELLTQAGEHMLRYAGANHQNAPEAFALNGATFSLSTGNATASISEVLDQFHAKCRHESGVSSELFDGVFRSESGTSGIVACLETGAQQLGADVLLARIQGVLATGDLSQLGQLRYVYATKASATTTAFVALGSDGSVKLHAMFPARGDAPGSDPAGIPRPSDSRRLLSSAPKSGGTNFNVYSAPKRRADALLAFYRLQLPAAGYTLITNQPGLMVAQNGRALVTVAVHDDERSASSVATVAVQY